MSRPDASEPTGAVTPIVLAAGAGSRFHDRGHKLTAPLPATTLRPAESVASRAIAAAVAADLDAVIVITGRLTAAQLGLDESGAATDPTTAIHNDAWEDGQMTSIRAGLGIAESRGSDIAVIGLADQPGIEPAAWRAVAAAVSTASPIAVAVYDGERGNPVALHRSIWGLLPREGDVGARSLMRLRPDLVVEVPCSGSPTDIDTTEDLRRWQNN